ncbi:organic solute transporter subunit alpha-like [Palaemon carinicauda]|uniref:organic solute transporter subunit alpha-like n=1 Tax=Palaemon carinicauda TaxID=392227 RepID=UPI0035B6A83B
MIHHDNEDCNYDYIPKTVEYMQGLGLYGIWLLILGGVSFLLLLTAFLEQVFFSQSGAHRVYRRHIYWIASVYPFMTFMSLVSVVIPRAHNICTSVKTTYMAIGIGHFIDLTVLMYGSEEVILDRTSGERLRLRMAPVCCCCCCLPSPKITKMSLRMTIFLVDQFAFVQAFYYISLLILVAGDMTTIGDVSPDNAYLWLSLLNMVSFMSGIWGLRILANMSQEHLKHYNYNNKVFSMKILILVTNFQTYVLQILGNYNVFPCIPPYISPQVFRQTVENSLYFLEMLVLGCYTYYQYHTQEFLQQNPCEVTQNKHSRSATVSTTVSSESGQSDIDQLPVIVEEPRRHVDSIPLESQMTFSPERSDDICTSDHASFPYSSGSGSASEYAKSALNPGIDNTRQKVQVDDDRLFVQLTEENPAFGNDGDYHSSTSSV